MDLSTCKDANGGLLTEALQQDVAEWELPGMQLRCWISAND